jgi:dihydrofolate reductase
VQLLLENDLVDELRLITYPLILGEGKKVFADGAAPITLELVDGAIGKSGIVLATYKRAGEVKTGTVGA